MSNAVSSFGILLKIGDGGGPETFTTIAEVQDIAGPKLALATEEVTHHTSTGGYDEFIGTIKSGGEVTFDLNFIVQDATQSFSTGLIKDYDDKTLRNFTITWTDTGTTTWPFSALVTAFEPDGPVSGKLSAAVTLKISGQPGLA